MMGNVQSPWWRFREDRINDYGGAEPEDIWNGRVRRQCTPERLLLLAVLDRAMNDAIDPKCCLSTDSPIYIKLRARRWFKRWRDNQPFTWTWIRTHLGLTQGEVETIYRRIGFSGVDFYDERPPRRIAA